MGVSGPAPPAMRYRVGAGHRRFRFQFDRAADAQLPGAERAAKMVCALEIALRELARILP